MNQKTILVVEDEGIIAMHLQRMLVGFGFRVPETVESGQEALLFTEVLHPDLVLMDIQLAGDLDGIETARRIRSRYDTPIVYLTAYAEDARLAQARQTEPYGYLVKPVQDRELRATIEMALYKHQLDMDLKESEAGYRELYHITPTMFHTIGPDRLILQVSDYWLSTLGYTREEVVGRLVDDFVGPAYRAYMEELVAGRLVEVGMVRDMECQFLHKNGCPLDVLFSMVAVHDDQGRMLRAHCALVDITDRKRAENAERDQRTLAEALRDTASALSSTLSLDEVLERVLRNVGKVVPHDAVNIMLLQDGIARIERCHGYGEREAEEMAKCWAVATDKWMQAMARTESSLILTNTADDPDWPVAWIQSYAAAPIIIKGRLVGFVNLIGLRPGFFQTGLESRLRAFADQVAIAIENARLYAEVERLATLDDVTGICNRRRLFELGQREFEIARRYKPPLSAILLDIDHFKKVNDTYGHSAGDKVLAAIGSVIKNNVREVDLFGRYGGEEFVVLLPQSGIQAGLEAAERLRALVENMHIETERGTLRVTISLGVAEMEPGVPSLANLIDRADQAMYAAKQAGRNRVEKYHG